jgi:hypothetical protein
MLFASLIALVFYPALKAAEIDDTHIQLKGAGEAATRQPAAGSKKPRCANTGANRRRRLGLRQGGDLRGRQ